MPIMNYNICYDLNLNNENTNMFVKVIVNECLASFNDSDVIMNTRSVASDARDYLNTTYGKARQVQLSIGSKIFKGNNILNYNELVISTHDVSTVIKLIMSIKFTYHSIRINLVS